MSSLLAHPHRTRILVADSDDAARAFYRESLKLTGCEVVDAMDGRAAVIKALVQQPSLVITETRLPLCDGYALCEVLRRDSTSRRVPIVVVTSETRLASLERARAAGADAILVKPISPETLLVVIQGLLGGSEPASPPSSLACPVCEGLLTYERSHRGGKSRRATGPWDAYTCAACSSRFAYRPRTRTLQRAR